MCPNELVRLIDEVFGFICKLIASSVLKASFWGLFKTYFYCHFRKLFLFTKFEFLSFGKKFFLTVLKSTCLEFGASNYNWHGGDIYI